MFQVVFSYYTWPWLFLGLVEMLAPTDFCHIQLSNTFSSNSAHTFVLVRHQSYSYMRKGDLYYSKRSVELLSLIIPGRCWHILKILWVTWKKNTNRRFLTDPPLWIFAMNPETFSPMSTFTAQKSQNDTLYFRFRVEKVLLGCHKQTKPAHNVHSLRCKTNLQCFKFTQGPTFNYNVMST